MDELERVRDALQTDSVSLESASLELRETAAKLELAHAARDDACRNLEQARSEMDAEREEAARIGSAGDARVAALQDELDALQAAEQRANSLETALRGATADIQMKQADLIQSQEASANLQGVLDEFTAGKARADAAVAAELKQLRADAGLREAAANTRVEAAVAAKQVEVDESAARCRMLEQQVETAFRKGEELVGELQRIQAAAAAKTATDKDQVDRSLVVKLLVTYFEKNESGEVLELMCRILDVRGIGIDTHFIWLWFR